MISDIGRQVVQKVSVPEDNIPWIVRIEDGKERRYYDDRIDPFLMLKDQPKSFGVNSRTNMVDFIFYEGCDLDVVMLFKLTWA